MTIKRFYLSIVFVAVFILNTTAQSGLKSVSIAPPFIDTTKIVTITSPVSIASEGAGQWWIFDNDPSSAEFGYPVINKGDNAAYDDEIDDYAVEVIGHRKGTDEPENTNSFMLWAPTDSGIPWNYTNSRIKFSIKIKDGEDWGYGNTGNFGIYVWVAVKHGWDDKPMPKRVLFQAGEYGKFLDPNNYRWSDYYPTGLGDDLADGKWHTFEVDLIEIIENAKRTCINNGTTDSNLGTDPTEGVMWHWYGVLGLEVRALHTLVGKVEVLDKASAIESNSFSNAFNIYPNPSTGIVNVRLSNNSMPVSIKISDCTGRQIITFKNIHNRSELNLSSLVKGIYFVTVNDGIKSKTQKIVIE